MMQVYLKNQLNLANDCTIIAAASVTDKDIAGLPEATG